MTPRTQQLLKASSAGLLSGALLVSASLFSFAEDAPVQSRPAAASAADIDGDGKTEAIVRDNTIFPAESFGLYREGRRRFDIIRIGTKGGAKVLRVSKTEDNDRADDEIVVVDPDIVAGATSGTDLDKDGDFDIIFVSAEGGGGGEKPGQNPKDGVGIGGGGIVGGSGYNTGLARYNPQLARYNMTPVKYDMTPVRYDTTQAAYKNNLATYKNGLAGYNTTPVRYPQAPPTATLPPAQFTPRMAVKSPTLTSRPVVPVTFTSRLSVENPVPADQVKLPKQAVVAPTFTSRRAQKPVVPATLPAHRISGGLLPTSALAIVHRARL